MALPFLKKTDALLIGAGPAGIAAALYLARGGISFVWLEKGAPGGKLLTVSEVDNYPGLPQQTGPSLAMALLKSTEALGLVPEYGDVLRVRPLASGFEVATEEGFYETQALIVATGLANVPTVPGEKDLLGRGISYCASCDGPLYKGKAVGLSGAGERAYEEALFLSGLVSRLYLFVPSLSKGQEPALWEPLLRKGNVEAVAFTKILALQGGPHLEKVVYEGPAGQTSLPVVGFFPLLGEKSAAAFLSPLGIKSEHGFLTVDATMMTSVKGVFAAGDLVVKKVRQAVTAAADGAVAATAVIAYLRGGRA